MVWGLQEDNTTQLIVRDRTLTGTTAPVRDGRLISGTLGEDADIRYTFTVKEQALVGGMIFPEVADGNESGFSFLRCPWPLP